MGTEEMYDNEQRESIFKKNSSLENALNDINNLIEPLGSNKLQLPQKPIVLIMGCARSGSTLMMQYLAATGIFSYPSNLIARFYKNPYLGIRIQQAILEYDPLNQLEFKNTDLKSFNSNLGKTSGAIAPSEFWYFWREYFKFLRFNYLNDDELSSIKSDEFLKKLSPFEILTSKPLVMKGMILNWNIPYLYSIYPRFIFINLKRDIIANAQSLLSARKKFFNDETKWYSFKPLEFEELKLKSPIEQVVGQVYYTQKAIEKGLKNIPTSNKIEISYEKFCEEPNMLLNEIKKRFVEFESTFKLPINNPSKLEIRNKKSPSNEELDKFREALNIYF